MPLKKPELLVLDGQGVVFDAPIATFLSLFARSNGLDFASVERRWQEQFRHLAWTGAIDDDALWNALAGKKVDVQQTMDSLHASYTPGPAASHIVNWSTLVPIWLLSNHRSHWLLPHLDAFNLASAFKRILISDVIGSAKPDPEAFTQLVDSKIPPGDILFVDDQAHNIDAAGSLGLSTLLASPESAWVQEIDNSLRG